ncbi:MAG: hypothetical protein AAGE52_19465 [Myxococcota bacterium]
MRVFLLALALFSGSCVDTALSLVVDVREATIVVESDDEVSVDLTLDVRVGRFALAGDDFVVPRAGILVDEIGVTEVVLNRPEGFDGRLEPGESTVVRIQGTAPASAAPTARAQLCGGGSATVLVTWIADEQPDDPLDPPIRSMGNASLDTSMIVCE